MSSSSSFSPQQAGGSPSRSLDESWVGFSSGDFQSQSAAAAAAQSAQHQPQHGDDSVTSSVLSHSFSSSFAASRRSSLEYSSAARRNSLLLGTTPAEEAPPAPCPPSRKRVRFHSKVQVQIAISRSDYSEAETAATWYSKADGDAMKRDVLLTVRAMRQLHERRVPANRVDAELAIMFSKGGAIDDDKTTTDRGLEHMRTTRSVENRRKHKEHVKNAVLDEQDALWDEHDDHGDHDDAEISAAVDVDAEVMRLAEACMVASRPARQDAARKGQRDAQMAEQWKRRQDEEEAAAAAMTTPTPKAMKLKRQRASRSIVGNAAKVAPPPATEAIRPRPAFNRTSSARGA